MEVDAGGGTDTVDLGGVTQLTFPVLDETSVDVEDSSADSVTGSESRDVVHADNAWTTVSTGVGDDWVEGAGQRQWRRGQRHVPPGLRFRPGWQRRRPDRHAPGGSPRRRQRLRHASWSTTRSSPARQAVGLAITDDVHQRLHRHLRHRGVRHHVVRRGARRTASTACSYSGRVSFHSRAGDDTFLGGPGADVADLGPGNDVVDPGPGSDFVLAGDGDDSVAARDGFGDVVECGPGNDTVTADRADVLSGCENVALPAPETSRIDGPKKVTKGTKAFFTFAASVASATFECQVDTRRVQDRARARTR